MVKTKLTKEGLFIDPVGPQWDLLRRGIDSLNSGRLEQARAEFNSVDAGDDPLLQKTRHLKLRQTDALLFNERHSEKSMKLGLVHRAKGEFEHALSVLQIAYRESKEQQTVQLKGPLGWGALLPVTFSSYHGTTTSIEFSIARATINFHRAEDFVYYTEAKKKYYYESYEQSLELFNSVKIGHQGWNLGSFKSGKNSLTKNYISKCETGIQISKAKVLLSEKSYDEALSFIEAINSSDSGDPIIIRRASLLRKEIIKEKAKNLNPDTEDPMKFLDEALGSQSSADTLTLKAKILFEQKEYKEAINFANRALELDSDNVEAKLVKFEAIKLNGQIIKDAFGLTESHKVSNLTIGDIFSGIEILEKIGYCNARGESISMVIGSTRCGKSTTLNLLLGNQLVLKKEGSGLDKKFSIVKREEDPEDKFPVIGHKTTSETTIPMKYELGGKQLWDCPGFGDTRGAQQEIINAWFVNRLFTTASEVKLINLCASTSFVGTDNVSEFLSYINQIKNLFGKEELGKINQILVFTKTDAKYDADEYKAKAVSIIEEHFPDESEVLGFFKNAKVVKIDKVETEGEELTRETIADLVAMYDSEPYQKIEPHVGIDDKAKVFLEETASGFSKMISKYWTSLFEKESECFVQKLKYKLSDILAQDKAAVEDSIRRLSKEAIEDFKSEESVQSKLRYFDNLIEFICKVLDRKEIVESIEKCQENFWSFFKDKIDSSLSSISDRYFAENSAMTFGEYAWHHNECLGDIHNQIESYN